MPVDTTPLTISDNARIGTVSYNGVRFPPALSSKASFSPVYDDAGRVVKYVQGKISIECYIFPGCLGASPGSTTTVYRKSDRIHLTDPDSPTDCDPGGLTTEGTLNQIRNRLTESCQPLTFAYQGAGTITLNGAAHNPLQSSGTGQQDVNNGPKPQEVRWTPITNKMAQIEWQVEFAFCPSQLATAANPVSPYAQFPFDISHSIGPNGTTVRTITGCIEVPLTRRYDTPQLTSSFATGKFHAGASQAFDMLALEKKVLDVFPVQPQFKRQQEFKLSKDRKRLDFSIVDSEINSDEAFGPGIANENVTLSAEGSLKSGGFRKWSVTLSGEIDVMAGFPKSVAVTEMNRLATKYYVSLPDKGLLPPELTNNNYNDGSVPTPSKNKAHAIMQNQKYTDHLFGRTMEFVIRWDLFVALNSLFDATGLFRPISVDDSARISEWVKWSTSIGKVLDDGGYHQLGFTQTEDIVVSLCTPWIGPTKGKQIPVPANKKAENQNPFDNSALPVKTGDVAKLEQDLNLYSMYENSFWIEARQHTLNHYPLKYGQAVQEKVRSNPKSVVSLTYPAKSPQPTGTPLHPVAVLPEVITHKIRPTTYILHCAGAAIRLNHPPDVPHVESYGGLKVTKFADDIIRPVNGGGGVEASTGMNYGVHGLAWHKQYILPGGPADATINSDGHPQTYV